MVIHHTGGRGGGDRGRGAAAEVQAAELMRLLNRMPPKLIRPLMCRALCVTHPPSPPGSRAYYFPPVTLAHAPLNTHSFTHMHAFCGLEGIDSAFGSRLGQTCDLVSLFSDFFFFFPLKRSRNGTVAIPRAARALLSAALSTDRQTQYKRLCGCVFSTYIKGSPFLKQPLGE